MGAGIAQWCSAKGKQVILKDIGVEPLRSGMESISKIYRNATRKHVFTKTEARQGLDRVWPVHHDIPLNVDLVIEAATENMDVRMSQ